MDIAVWLTHPEVECWNFRERHAERIVATLGRDRVRVRMCSGEGEFLEALPDAVVAIVWRFREAWLESARKLEWIVTPAAGRDYFQLEPRPGLDVDYGTFHGEIMGETVLALVLSHCRGVIRAVALAREHPWPRRELGEAMRPLRGSRLAILGFGRIGRWVGRLAAPFGVEITGIKRVPAGRPEYFGSGDRIVPVEQLDDVLPSTDFLVICLPSGEDTDAIIDRRRLALLPPHAVIINVGRGNAIDEQALAEALAAGRLAAACLDVYRVEPLPVDSPLRSCAGALLMPHVSAVSPNYLDLFVDEFVRRFERRYSGGDTPPHGAR